MFKHRKEIHGRAILPASVHAVTLPAFFRKQVLQASRPDSMLYEMSSCYMFTHSEMRGFALRGEGTFNLCTQENQLFHVFHAQAWKGSTPKQCKFSGLPFPIKAVSCYAALVQVEFFQFLANKEDCPKFVKTNIMFYLLAATQVSIKLSFTPWGPITESNSGICFLNGLFFFFSIHNSHYVIIPMKN